jgi:gliding motility-associated-like protein
MRTSLLFFFVLASICGSAQQSYTINSSQNNEKCSKGAAGVQVKGLQSGDALSINWSHGPSGVNSVNNLNEGEYSAHITVLGLGDTINKIDTTIVFKIEKEKCEVSISNHFTPNGDNYNDLWQIGNWNYYPKFELYVFNKWGQQVHSQRGDYTPWDGRWAGINVPDGTYYYVFYYDGGNKKDLLKGDVTILR